MKKPTKSQKLKHKVWWFKESFINYFKTRPAVFKMYWDLFKVRAKQEYKQNKLMMDD